MKQFQQKNCITCRYSDPKKAGSGMPCCKYPGRLFVVDGVCLKRKKLKGHQNG